MKLHGFHEGPNFQEDLNKCCYCGFCLQVCPLYRQSRKEPHSPLGKVLVLKEFGNGNAFRNQEIRERLELCLGCGACYEHCPHQIPLHQIVAKVKNQAINGFEPALHWKLLSRLFLGDQKRWQRKVQIYRILRNVYAFPLVPWPLYRLQGIKRYAPQPSKESLISQGAPGVTSPTSLKKLTLFAGCLTNFFFTTTGKSVLNLLAKLGYAIDLPREQVCCGSPLFYTGNRREALNLVRKNTEVLKKNNPNYIITVCGACGEMLKMIYPSVLPEEASDFRERVKDVTEILAKHIPQIRPKYPNQKIAYYDSCRLRRGMGVFNEPRELLKYHYPKFTSVRRNEDCCGFAGPFSAFNYPLSLKIAQSKVAYLKDAQVRRVVVGDPGCRIHLSDSIRRAGLEIEVVHPADLYEAA